MRNLEKDKNLFTKQKQTYRLKFTITGGLGWGDNGVGRDRLGVWD